MATKAEGKTVDWSLFLLRTDEEEVLFFIYKNLSNRRRNMLRIEKYIENVFMDSIHKLYPDKELKPIEITIATNEKFGDFQTNFAMMNSKIIGGNPRKIAEDIVKQSEKTN